MLIRYTALCVGLLAILFTPASAGELTRSELEALLSAQQEQMLELQQQIQDLTQLVAGVQADQEVLERRELDRTASYQAGSWMERTTISGDFRIRYEIQDNSMRDNNRDRLRARTRIRLLNQLSDDIRLGFRIVSGDTNVPTSTTTTFGESFSKKQVWFDQFFAHWIPSEWIAVTAGKFPIPFDYTSMKFSSNVMFEGAAQEFRFGDETMDLRLRLGQFMLDEISWNSGNDIWLLAYQAGGYFNLSDDFRLDAMLGYWDYTSDLSRRSLHHGTRGNRHIAGVRTDDYSILKPHLALYYSGIENWPIKVYAEYVQNLDTSTGDEGWHVGIGMGRTRQEGDIAFNAYYQNLEANAVLDILTDGTFHGGGTNNKGFALMGTYVLRDNWNINVRTYFAKEDSGPKHDFNTYQLNVNWRF